LRGIGRVRDAHAQHAAEPGDVALHRSLEEVGVGGIGEQRQLQARQQRDVLALGRLRADDAAHAGADARGVQLAPRLVLALGVVAGLAQVALGVVGELGLQGQGLAHGAADMMEGHGQAGGLVVVLGRLGALGHVAGQAEAEPGQLIEDEVGPLDGPGCVRHEQNKNTRTAHSQVFSGVAVVRPVPQCWGK